MYQIKPAGASASAKLYFPREESLKLRYAERPFLAWSDLTARGSAAEPAIPFVPSADTPFAPSELIPHTI
jgi:hypothetical protein